MQAFPAYLKSIGDQIKEELDKKLPDYKGQVDNVKSTLGTFSRQVGGVQKAWRSFATTRPRRKEVRDYASGSIDHFSQMKKLADDQLDEDRQAWRAEARRSAAEADGLRRGRRAAAPAIAVEGPSDIKLIDFKDVWKSGESTGLSPGAAARRGSALPASSRSPRPSSP